MKIPFQTERQTEKDDRHGKTQKTSTRAVQSTRARDDTDEGEEVHEENTYSLHGPERAPSVAAAT